MCGRFTRYLSWSEIHRLYRLTAPEDIGRNAPARYNIAPTEDVLFVTQDRDGAQKLREGRWWLVPWWAKETPKAAMFNARIETADTSGAFNCLEPRSQPCRWRIRRTNDAFSGWRDSGL
ncbi:MAG: SOS response-associated peptidase family protein [Mesorhizobium sp.]|nr:SOS response-associated peptidase family protein [Mesorhizobium sp.]